MPSAITADADYDAFCQQRLSDPHPFFHRLRAEDPVHWSQTLQCWLITRYDDAFAGIRDPRVSSSRAGLYMNNLSAENRDRARPMVEHLSKWVLNVDAPDHTRLRKLVNVAFTPRMLKRLEPQIEQLVNELLDGVCAQRRFDFVRDFSYRLTSTVICRMLGIPNEDQDDFRAAAEVMINFSSAAGPRLNEAVPSAHASYQRLIRYFDDIIDQRRRHPQEDLISDMLAVNENNDRFTQEELFAMCVFLSVAGHETTMSGTASGMLLLIQNSDQYELLRKDADKHSPSAVEEFLRLESPAPRSVRMAREDFELRGQTIQKGQTIVTLLGAANRDPDQFPDPDRVDILRHPNRHLGFGFGPHFCLGAPLARLESGIALRNIVRRKLQLRMLENELHWRPNLGLRSLERLPVEIVA